MDSKHWTNINPLTITTTTTRVTNPIYNIGEIFPPEMVNHIFRYKIGDKFIDNDYGDTIEIKGYNYMAKSYLGVITLHIGDKVSTIESNMIYENRLNNMSMIIDKPSKKYKKDETINYRIYYFEEGKGNRPIQRDVKLSNIRALVRYLNSTIKTYPKRRIVMVAILDENGTYAGQVKLLRKEIQEQKFLTGMKERLLAYAKYECGYEVATNF